MQIRTFMRITAFIGGFLFFSPVAAEEVVSVNVNTASAEEIATALVGVGPAKAQAIVEYREANGAFQDVYELENVKGIGARTIDRNQTRIRVK
jgi:competence protein ComEA